MAKTQYLTAPLKTEKMPPGVPYIVGNEAAERFSYYGMNGILVIFMTTMLRNRLGDLAVMSETEANGWYHTFVTAVYGLPLIGAFLADAVLGKYRTVFWLSIVYCFGHFALALDDTRLGLVIGLSLIALGAGGIKPCVSANVGDQFGPSNQHLLMRVYSCHGCCTTNTLGQGGRLACRASRCCSQRLYSFWGARSSCIFRRQESAHSSPNSKKRKT